MLKDVEITIENRLAMEKRHLNVHHSTIRSHVVSFNNSETISLAPVSQDDYILVSAHPGRRDSVWQDCLINLPAWVDFEFLTEGKVTLIHSGNRILVRKPSGPPTWHLRLTRPIRETATVRKDFLIIGDDEFIMEVGND